MKFSKYIIIGGIALSMGFTSCVDDLDVSPENPTTKLELTTAEDYYALMARVYGGLVLEGGIAVDNGGAGVYTRQLWNVQELPSDEAIVGYNWNDAGIQELGFSTWSSDNHWLYECFSRFNYQIALCNEFLRTIGNASGLIAEDEINTLRCEARVLRDLSYYHMIDIFGRGPWTDENSVVGATPPTYDRKQLFEATVADLTAYVDNLLPAAQQTYGRLSREAGYMILAKLYLNAEVYTGTAMWQQCADALKNVVATGIQLAPEYKYLFCASNSKYVGNGEIIFGLPQDRNRLTSWGGTTELTCAAYMEADDSDTPLARQLLMLNFPGTPWSGLRVRPELSKALKGDPRRLIYEGSYQEDIPDLTAYNETSCGYMLVKYTFTTEDDYYNEALVNKFDEVYAWNNDPANENDPEYPKAYPQATSPDQMSEVDLPVFRLADAYLMLAECQLNGANVNINGLDGYAYFNMVRDRVGLAPIAQPTANEILHERQCELYAEGFRRSDLIRFNRYTGSNYLWSWKGGDFTGTAIHDTRAVFPIPYQYVITVGQNAGY